MRGALTVLLAALALAAMGADVRWNGATGFAGWMGGKNLTCEHTPEGLKLTLTGRDPQLVNTTLSIDPRQWNAFRYRYRAEGTGDKGGQLFFATEEKAFSADAFWRLPRLVADGKWHVVTVDASRLVHPDLWRKAGHITALRFDPTDSAGGTVVVAEMEFLREAVPAKPDTAKPAVAKPAVVLDADAWPPIRPELGKYIGTPAPVGGCFEGLLITAPEDQANALPKGKRRNPALRCFALRLEVTLREKPAKAWLQFIADDEAIAYFNGVPVAQNAAWNRSVWVEAARFLQAGPNVIAFEYTNYAYNGGVMAEVLVQYADGSHERIVTDRGFRAAAAPADGSWRRPGFDASAWKAAAELPGPPHAPWITPIPYHNFACAQSEASLIVRPAAATAGDTVRLHGDFTGPLPRLPAVATIQVLRNGTVAWSDDIRLDGRVVRAAGDGRWTLDLDYTLPLYLNDGEAQLELMTAAVAFPNGVAPKARLQVSRKALLPGFAQAPVASLVAWPGGGLTFAVNGKPLFPLIGGVTYLPRPDRRPRQSDAPLDIVAVYADVNQWWPASGQFNPVLFDHQAELYRRSNPTAWFIWDLTLYPPRSDWHKTHPDEMCRDETGEMTRDGNRLNHSFASKTALADMQEALRQAISYLEQSPYANRIIGYRINGGHTIEWLGWNPPAGRASDFSRPNTEAFRRYCARKYPQLRNPAVPTFAELSALDDGGLLWDPARHLNAIAYNEWHSLAVVEMMVPLLRTARELTRGRKLVGTYYGYTMTLNANGHSQQRAHFALKALLDAKCVDFLMSPHPYDVRHLGEPCGDMKPFATMAANGVVPMCEDDTRTFNMPAVRAHGQTFTEELSTAILRRNAGFYLARNQPVYFYAITDGTNLDYPQFARDMARVKQVGERCVAGKVRRNAEIALVASESSVTAMPMLHQSVPNGETMQFYAPDGSVRRAPRRNTILTGEIHAHIFTRASRIGAPVDYLLAEDLAEHPGNYKLYLFLNCFRYDDAFLKAVKRLRERGCTLLWLYAPGCISGTSYSVANMERLTGFRLEEATQAMAPMLVFPDGRAMGAPGVTVRPLFRVKDPAADPMARYADATVGCASKRTGKGRDIFCGTWQLDVPFLRETARRAGVHLFSDTTDPFEANDATCVLFARFAGRKTIRLPRKTTVVDVFDQRVVARDADVFSFEAPLHTTHLFYYGDDAEELLR